MFIRRDHQGLAIDDLSPEEQPIAEELATNLLENATYSSNEADSEEATMSWLAIQDDVPGSQGVEGVKKKLSVIAAKYLDRIPWFSRASEFGLDAAAAVGSTLAQVTRYLKDPAIHNYAVGQVNEHGHDTLVVIGHSLGSVVAYDAVRAYLGGRIPLLITLGSPLGLGAVNRRLTPQPPAFPAAVQRWENIASPDDIVAARPYLHEVFDGDRPEGAVFARTWKVDNGSSKPHQIEHYLNKESWSCPTRPH